MIAGRKRRTLKKVVREVLGKGILAETRRTRRRQLCQVLGEEHSFRCKGQRDWRTVSEEESDGKGPRGSWIAPAVTERTHHGEAGPSSHTGQLCEEALSS